MGKDRQQVRKYFQIIMANKIRSLISMLAGPGLIFVVWAFIAASTYKSGTILSGWDNLHPEFNFGANISRSLSAVWQEYQGVGLLGGMGHAAELPRQIVLATLSVVINADFIRYFWTFGMLLLGPLGAYFFSRHITKNSFAATASGLTYLLNFTAVQVFFVPFEAFTTFYGVLPMLLFVATLLLESANRRTVLLYLTLLVLGATAFYIQTHFVVYAMLITVILLEYFFRNRIKSLKNIYKLLLATFVATAFWLLPVGYFALSGSDTLLTAKTSVMPTLETKLMNQAFGDPENIVLMKGFWLEYSDASENEFDYLMPFWREHTNGALFEIVGYILFTFSVLGVLLGLILRRRKWEISIFAIYLLSVLMLTTGRGVLGLVYETLSDTVPLFGQMFRSSFTKWSAAYALSYALGIGLFISYAGKLARKYAAAFSLSLMVIFAVLLSAQMHPLYQGRLISDAMKVEYPQEYFELFEYFRTQPKEARIARFPVQTFWGWDYYSWGYRGSGFLWYGIEQPILDRAFDMWSRENEEYYFEIFSAVYSEDTDLVKKVLEKYGVTYLILDKSVVVPGQDGSTLRLPALSDMFSRMGAEIVFDKGDVTVYKFGFAPSSFVYGIGEYTKASADFSRVDMLYRERGNYISDTEGAVYPFSGLTAERPSGITYETDLFGGTHAVVRGNVPQSAKELVLPAFEPNTIYTFKATASYIGNEFRLKIHDPYEIFLGGEPIENDFFEDMAYIRFASSPENIIVSVGGQYYALNRGQSTDVFFSSKISEPLDVKIFNASDKANLITTSAFAATQINNCWSREGAEAFIESNFDDGVLSIETSNAVGCAAYKMADLAAGEYLLEFSLNYSSPNGARPYYCIQQEGQPECINRDIFYTSATSYDWAKITQYHPLPGGASYWAVTGGRPPDTVDEKWKINYQRPEAHIYPMLSRVIFDNAIFEGVTKSRTIAVPDGTNEIALKMPTTSVEVDFALAGRANAFNCDVFTRGTAGKTVSERGVVYLADEYGGSCDHVSLPQGINSGDYLINFIGGNVSGRGLRFYLYNNAKRYAPIEGLLPGEEFNSTYSLLSQMHGGQSDDYILNVSIQSFRDQAESFLSKVVLYPVPISPVSKIMATGPEETGYVGETEVADVRKNGTALYRARVSSSGESGVFVLSQGYDSGWRAFSGMKALAHTRVNGWANGWVVPEGEHAITIIYLPQLLQWAGFILLAAFSVPIFVKSVKK